MPTHAEDYRIKPYMLYGVDPESHMVIGERVTPFDLLKSARQLDSQEIGQYTINQWNQLAVEDATERSKGVLRLAGGLDGSADRPQLGSDSVSHFALDMPGVGPGLQQLVYGWASGASNQGSLPVQASNSTGPRIKHTSGATASNTAGRTTDTSAMRIECGFRSWHKFQTGSDITNQRLFIGYMDSVENEDAGTNRTVLRYSSVIGANFFFLTSTAAKVPQATDTGVVVAADTTYVLGLSAPIGGGSVRFRLWNSDESVLLASATHSTQLPDQTNASTLRMTIITLENVAKHFYHRGNFVRRP